MPDTERDQTAPMRHTIAGVPDDAEYVVMRRSDVEALVEEYALDGDPFWRPVEGVTVALPACSCGSVGLYAENPPRLGPHHNAACGRHRTTDSNATRMAVPHGR